MTTKRIIVNNCVRHPNEYLALDKDSNELITVESIFRMLQTDYGTRESKVSKSGLIGVSPKDKDALNILLDKCLERCSEGVRNKFLNERSSLKNKIVLSPTNKVDLFEIVEPIKRVQGKTAGVSKECTSSFDGEYLELQHLLEYIGSDRVYDDFRPTKNQEIFDLIVNVSSSESFTIKRKDVGLVSNKDTVKKGMIRFDFGSSAIHFEDVHLLRRYASYCVDEPPVSQLPESNEKVFCQYLEIYSSEADFRIGSDKAKIKLRSSTTLVSAYDLYKTFFPTSSKTVFKKKWNKNSSTTFVDSRAGKYPIEGLEADEIEKFIQEAALKQKILDLVDSESPIIILRKRRSVKIDKDNEINQSFSRIFSNEVTESATILNDIMRPEDNSSVVDLPPIILSTSDNEEKTDVAIVDSSNQEAIILDSKFEFLGKQIRYQSSGERWTCLRDVILSSGHCKENHLNREISRLFNEPQFGVHCRKTQFRDSRNIPHTLDVIPFSQVIPLISTHLRGSNANSLRAQMATLHSRWQSGDEAVIQTTLMNRDISAIAPQDSFIGVNAQMNQESPIQIENSAIDPITTAQNLGMPSIERVTITRTPASERISFYVRGKMEKQMYDELYQHDTFSGFYMISFHPKLSHPPLNCPKDKPPGCMSLVCSKLDTPVGGAKFGMFSDNGLDRIRLICDTYFQPNIFEIEIKMAFIDHSASTLEKSVKKYLSKQGYLPQNPSSRSNYVLDENGLLNKLTETIVYTQDFGEEDLINLINQNRKKLIKRVSSPVKLGKDELLKLEIEKLKIEKEKYIVDKEKEREHEKFILSLLSKEKQEEYIMKKFLSCT